MKKLFSLITALILVSVFAVSSVTSVEAISRVRSYYRSSGTYVQSYYRTSPNNYRYDNYSSRGNYNPYTGSKGYKSWY